MSTFYQKPFLKLLDFTASELTALLQLAAKLKADKKTVKKNKSWWVKILRSSSKKTRPGHDALSKLPHTIRGRA